MDGAQMFDMLCRLELDLRLIREQYDTADPSDDRAVKDRTAACKSLIAVINFIDSVPEWKKADISFALTRLMVALNNITRGTTEEMLVPSRTGSRPFKPFQYDAVQGWCAAAAEIMIKSGKTKQEACSYVFRNLGKSIIARLAESSGHQYPTWRTVARWRDKAETDKNSDNCLSG